MRRRTRITTVALSVMLAAGALGAPMAVEAKAKHYANCTALQKVYPHGVGKPGAKDKVSGRYQPGRSVINFKKSTALYNANDDKDRDGDGIACEKK
ncbi:MAG: excalibur calcium-binding domain-containing protein [Chloroflexota bacterium]